MVGDEGGALATRDLYISALYYLLCRAVLCILSLGYALFTKCLDNSYFMTHLLIPKYPPPEVLFS